MEYVNAHVSDATALLLMGLLAILRPILGGEKIKMKSAVLPFIFCMIFAAYPYSVYCQFKYGDVKTDTISVEKSEIKYKKTTILDKKAHREGFTFITTSNGDEYLLANTDWEQKFKDGVYISAKVSIDYVETHKFKAIKDMKMIN